MPVITCRDSSWVPTSLSSCPRRVRRCRTRAPHRSPAGRSVAADASRGARVRCGPVSPRRRSGDNRARRLGCSSGERHPDTPGRSARGLPHSPQETSSMSTPADTKAQQILSALGGQANVVDLEPCITRLRVEVTDPELVDEAQLKATGAFGVVRSGRVVQVIVGPEADNLAAELDGLR
ncbi:glucose PTS transporter subunit EIIB [Cellulosimicrobium sp. CUA-896]|uniref:glucose PTS transporter subunit EIIB n=1 Tax=Cellulosimicrobium sp. CUA-896 TaxID=1517881 RepID=UPI0021019BA2|nr:PTS glucose/sucrose transporter subunit IIB [Cellulosimicrobium sp. CUA-896]